MSALDSVRAIFRPSRHVALQTEAAECGLACLVMVLAAHGHVTDLSVMRSRFSISLKGASLAQLIAIAAKVKLSARAVAADMDTMDLLQLPCVLHWNFNHYVVLSEVTSDGFVILDPARGERKVTRQEMSNAFTGVALELWPSPEFVPRAERQPLGLSRLFTGTVGVFRSLGQVAVLAIALEAFALLSPYYMKLVVDNVIVGRDRDFLVVLATGFCLLVVVQQALSAMRAWMLTYLSTSISLQWRSNVFGHLLDLPLAYFQKRTLGDIVSRFGSLDQIQRTLTTSFVEAVLDGVMSLSILVMMFVFCPMLAWISLGAVVLLTAARLASLVPQRKATEEQLVHGARQHSHFLESVRGVKTLKLFVKQVDRRAGWLTLLVNQYNADVKTQRLTLGLRTANGVVFGLENVLVIALGTGLVLDNTFSLGALMAFLAYKGQFIGRVSSLVDRAIEFKMLAVQTERLGDIVLTSTESTSDADVPGAFPASPSLHVDGLSFRYSEFEPWILRDVSLKVDAGESVAIVGPSGCGKTTLMNIVLGVLTATEGSISIGGHDTRRMSVHAARHLIGAVLQDDVLFAGTIGENIAFFDDCPDADWVRECARQACILADIEAMPMGLNTLVGDMGTVLSGGQKQRVLLARALYKKPKILFLDEATSHLDVTTERRVNEEIAKLKITRLIIAHRPETIASASRVVRLGSHLPTALAVA
jgi:ATP-binding cassette, subfamily B, bacterial CvaB/MchF/RaxB